MDDDKSWVDGQSVMARKAAGSRQWTDDGPAEPSLSPALSFLFIISHSLSLSWAKVLAGWNGSAELAK